MKRLTDTPLFLVDGGALDGLKHPWKQYAQYIKAIAFEPQVTHAELVDTKRVVPGESLTLDPIALSDSKQSSVPFYITAQPDSSSLLEPNLEVLRDFGFKKRFEIAKKVMVPTDTLDAQLSKQHVSFVDFIKLDTQGSELSILHGTTDTLARSVFGIEVEVNMIERYKGQNYFSDMDSFLRGHGFELFDLERRYCKRDDMAYVGAEKGQLTHGTALYFRSGRAAHKLILALPLDKRADYVFHYIFVLMLYGYADVAQNFLKKNKDLVPSEQHNEFSLYITNNTRAPFALFGRRGSYKLWQLFLKLARMCKPRSTHGTSGDLHLGNF